MPIEAGVWLLFLLLLVLAVPVYVALGLSTVIALMYTGIPLQMLPLDLYKVTEVFPLLAVPTFIFAGALMDKGGMAQQIVDVASIVVGRVRGGLALITIAGCMFFAAMIGSGPGTVAAMGTLMIPAMVRAGYGKDFAGGVAATGGTLGILIPPSNPMIIYGVVAGVSIPGMFMAGLIPGALVGLVLGLTAYAIARRKGLKGDTRRYTPSEIGRILFRSFFSLMAPVIILGGIYTGVFTPVEASVVAVVYAVLIGLVVTRELTVRGIWDAAKLTTATSGVVLIVVGVSILFGRFLTMYGIPQMVTEGMLSITENPLLILFLLIMLLFFLGMFMETLATIVIIVPIVMPLLAEIGVHPIHFGILLVMTNEVALLTPPLGVNLFVSMALTDVSLERMALAVLPFILALVGCVFLVMFVPEIALFLPRLLL